MAKEGEDFLKEYVIAVDAMGGDNAPEAIVSGAMEALRQFPDIRLMIYGPREPICALTAGAADVAERFCVIDAPDVIGMHESPTMAVRSKKNSSLVQAMLSVKEGVAQAVVSAGSTGAIVAGGILRMGRIQGIERPALAPLVPGKNKQYLLLDVGATPDCQPRYLEQFGLMGAIYMKQVLGISDPGVYLANIGTEEEKGDQRTKDAYQLMKAQSAYRFGGNVEAREMPTGDADVVVCDGFVGNVILKYTEGLASALFGQIKAALNGSLRGKVGGLLVKPVLKQFKDSLSADEHGGAPLLGCKGAIIKAHGNSNQTAIKNAIGQARKMVAGDVAALIEQRLGALSTKGQSDGE